MLIYEPGSILKHFMGIHVILSVTLMSIIYVLHMRELRE